MAGLHCLGRLLDVLTHIHSRSPAFSEVQIRPPGDCLTLWLNGHWVIDVRVSFLNGVIQIGLITQRGFKYRRVGGLDVLIDHFGVSTDWPHPIPNDITKLTCKAVGQVDPLFPRFLFTNVRYLFWYELLVVNAGYGEVGFQAIGNGMLRYGRMDEAPQTMSMTDWDRWIEETFGYHEEFPHFV